MLCTSFGFCNNSKQRAKKCVRYISYCSLEIQHQGNTKPWYKDVQWTNWKTQIPFLHSTLDNWLYSTRRKLKLSFKKAIKRTNSILSFFGPFQVQWKRVLLGKKKKEYSFSSSSGPPSYNPSIFQRKYLIQHSIVLIPKKR